MGLSAHIEDMEACGEWGVDVIEWLLDDANWENTIGKCATVGCALLCYQSHLVKQALETRHRLAIQFDSGDVFPLAANPELVDLVIDAIDCPILQDEIGQQLVELSHEKMSIVYHREIFGKSVYRLFSAGGLSSERGPDVGEIARKMGGNGTATKATFTK